MPATARRWASLAWTEFAELDPARTVVVLPVAAIEQHGPHLPLEVDATIVRGVLAAALERTAPDTPVLVLPECPVGKSDEHAAFPGTLSLSTGTLIRLWTEIGESVHRAGLRKLLFVNAHGGQGHVARIVAQDLRIAHGMVAVVANTYGFGEPSGLFPGEQARHGIHGGANETALVRALDPGAVREGAVDDFRPTSIDLAARHQELRFHGNGALAWAAQDLHPAGACGDARLGTEAAGRALVEHLATRLAVLIDELAALPLDVLRDGPRRTV